MVATSQFGTRLRTLRESQGISLNGMAKKLNVSSGYLSNLESGKTENVLLSTLQMISDLLPFDICPLCNQVKTNKSSGSNSDLEIRVEIIYHKLRDMIISDPQCLEFQLRLLERGLGIDPQNHLVGHSSHFETLQQ